MSNILDLQPIEAIFERDIDLLIIEELYSRKDFFNWFVSKTSNDINANFIKAFHSLWTVPKGETDIAILFESNNQKIMILCENKINADFQPEQAYNYRLRGDYHVSKNECDKFYTCLIAPKEYLSGNNEFDYCIKYEDIKLYFQNQKEELERYEHKTLLVDLAINKHRRGNNSTPDERAIDFHTKLYEYTNTFYPYLKIKKPNGKTPSKSTTFNFYPDVINNKKNISLSFIATGYADIQFLGMADKLNELKQSYNHSLHREMDFSLAGKKSVAIKIDFYKFDILDDFESQIELIKKALDKVNLLYHWLKNNLDKNVI